MKKNVRYRVGGVQCSVHFCSVPLVSFFKEWINPRNTLVITESNVNQALKIDSILAHHNVVVLPSGEDGKNWPSVDIILKKAMSASLDRKGGFYAIGGGALCDVAGFAAAIYLRGVGLCSIPTTLLCMVDAVFGGKCGINFLNYKNMVGSYKVAQNILVNINTLDTLSDSCFQDGIAEVIKSALLGDKILFDILKNNRPAILQRKPDLLLSLIQRSLKIKAAHVTRDYQEQNIRAHLNLGHTFAHALESVGNLSEWSHGRAVAWGIAQAMKLGVRIGVTNAAYAKRVIDLLLLYRFKIETPLDVSKIIEAMGQDKKRSGGDINLILQKNIGTTVMQKVPAHLITKSLGTNYQDVIF